MGSLEREDELVEFERQLVDRFGPIPEPTAQLLCIPRIRALARKLGIEKVNLKQGTIYLYFVGEENAAYYQSPMFGRILNYVKSNPLRCRIRNYQARNSIVISDVARADQALEILRQITRLDPS